MPRIEVINLLESLRECTACTLRKDARLPVPFEGVTTSSKDGSFKTKLMIVGRNPGRDEDATNRPFVGRGGVCLNEILANAGIDRDKVIITNLAKCYSLDDRPPFPLEYSTCFTNHLYHEIKTFQPKLVVALGNDCYRFLAQDFKLSVIKNRRTFFPLGDSGAKVVGILHPGSAVRSPQYKDMMREDFKWLTTTPEFGEAYSKID